MMRRLLSFAVALVLLATAADAQVLDSLGGGGGGGGSGPGGLAGDIQFNNGLAFGGFTAVGDCTITSSTGQVTCTKTNGVAFAPSATTDTTNAANISSGTLPTGRLTGSYTGITGVGTLTAGTWTATDIGVTYGGTGANLSATGGTSQVLKQVTTGAAVTVGQLAATDLSNGVSGSGAVVLVTGATLVTPTLGAATATSINKVAITAPGTSATLTIANGKTLTASNTLVLAGTDSTTMTFPATSASIAALNLTGQTVSGGVVVTSQSLGTASGTVTINCGNRPQQFLTNNGAFTLAAPASDSNCLVMSTNGASAGAITFSGFSVGSNTGDALDTTNGHIFTISIWRINSISGYRIAAMQ